MIDVSQFTEQRTSANNLEWLKEQNVSWPLFLFGWISLQEGFLHGKIDHDSVVLLLFKKHKTIQKNSSKSKAKQKSLSF